MTDCRSPRVSILQFASVLCMGAVSSASAQYSVAWNTIDGGGGTSSGGGYAISGTIGQPDAGAMASGAYGIQGGLWARGPINGILPGDTNCDGAVTVGDISGFVLALTNPGGYAAQYPDCDILSADINKDGLISVGDIGTFVALLTGTYRALPSAGD